MRVLVYRTGHLGDTVCAIPAFRIIRSHFPTAELTLLCDAPAGGKVPAAEVIGSLNLFDHVATYPSGRGAWTGWELARAVRASRPELAILLPQVRESAEKIRRKKKFFRGCGVADVRGLRFPTAPHEWQPNEPTRLVRLLHGVGIHGSKPPYGIPVNPGARGSVESKLRAAGIESGEPFLVFCGGGKAPTQRWLPDRHAGVLNAVATALPWPIIGLGSPPEVDSYRREILPRFAGLRLLKEGLTVTEIFELCRLSRAYYGNDTGPMHVAAAVGRPVAVLMSARNSPGGWDPDVSPSLVIRHRTECEDCFLTECLVERHRCMTAITAAQVIAEVIPFLKSLPAP